MLALALAAIAFLMQDPRRLGLECDPAKLEWYEQTHGWWHILISLAMLSLWFFFWSEEVLPKSGEGAITLQELAGVLQSGNTADCQQPNQRA